MQDRPSGPIRSIAGAFALALVASAPCALAQAPGDCPTLPADAGLDWTRRASEAFLICRAVDADGREAFGLYLAERSPFEPRRTAREERGTVAGQDVHWYRGEDAADPAKLVRETLVTLEDGRVMHVWLHARDRDQLQRNQQLVERLRFDGALLGRK
ncbi:hypothetical protein [Luteimonas huabeiensis]|uniref:hypothetical protein n=1 Tax=Luteimonas huabeiensis TaxID=1244513 RepID=UPI0004675DA0|nr:hypothetical protein [Luteimonas huabeiensis]